MTSRKTILILTLFSFLLGNVFSKNDYRFHTFSPEGGFFYDGIKSIVQDRDGFIWILQDNNILRLDGYEHKSYYPIFNSIDNHQRWFFNSMTVSPTGELYVATNNGLFIYNRTGGTFKSVFPGLVAELTIDSDNNIWLVHNGLLHRYNSQTSEVIPSLYEGNTIRHIAHFCTEGEGLYMATIYDRIYYCNYIENPNEISLLYQFSHTHHITDIRRVGSKLWVLTREHGLFKIDTETKQIKGQFDVFYEHEGEIISPRKLHIDKTGKIWIGTRQGLLIFDPQTNLYQVHRHSAANDFSLPNNSVWTIAEDAQKNIWIGTFSGGLSYVNIEDRPWFETYTTNRMMLNADMVSSFAEDDNSLWIGTDGGGINRIDKKTRQFTFHHSSRNGTRLLSNQIKSIVLDTGKNLWISMFVGGLSHYDTKTGQFTNFLVENGLLSNNLRKIILEKDSGLWIAYQMARPQISYFSFDTKTFTHYTLDETTSESYIFDFQRSDDGYLWLATPLKLYRFNIETRETEKIASEEGFLNAQSLFIDKENNIWIGTLGNGLFKYNTKNKDFTPFEEILSLNISTIYSICADSDNHLWLGTDNGLVRYNIENKSYTKFDAADGLQGQVYYPLAAMKGKNGELYFGGTNGFSIITPQNITQNQHKPNVIIADFLIDNVSALPTFKDRNAGFFENTIVLTHRQSNFGFRFSSDNYLIPQKNTFRYRLKGYDDRWITVDANNRTAFYSKIPAGTYQFEIMAANNDGVWNETPSVIRIKRRPAPLLSGVAYFIYVLIALSILAAIVHYYNDKRKLKMQLYLNDLDKQKKEEIHQSQLRFFTNISHDFRAPLFLILATINNLKEEGVKKYYHRILHNNATRLLNLVNELMDFKTVENGKMQLQVQKMEINPMVKDLYLDFEDYAKKNNIDFNIALDTELEYYQTYIDKQVLEKIIMNLLRNAFKYTHNGGKISIETYAEKSKFTSEYKNFHTVAGENTVANAFSIVIRDSGIGITKDSIESVFDRFYKVKTDNADNHLGTGIGLALVKSLVLLHKGEVTLFSEREKGTDIVVSLPFDSAIYTDNEFLNTESESEQMITRSLSENNEPKNAIKPISYVDDISPKGKKRILLVEDNNDLRTLISKFLSSSYMITEAVNGVEALIILKDTEVDLIVSDIMMPVKDGISLLKDIKNDINTSHIPVILLTAKTDLETKLESSEFGADLYFEKPIDLNLLQLSIQNVFTQYRKLRERYAKNFFADSAELSTNEKDNKFLQKLTEVIENNLDSSDIDVNYIASELLVSRSKLYSKVKMLTDMSTVEFILQYRLRKAARILIEEDLPVYQVMQMIGIQSQSYFTKVFKKEFDETPTAFAAKHKKTK
ncbi:MAG: response regulator [Dysgonamonadaceae bacterium]|jgi:signal transduction histidine kinase/ligand-binding sensor domain-containing protein/DNA-binding response OmpR family regulator|nr:response regulator [Dysgonamonadaceae bacterium]